MGPPASSDGATPLSQYHSYQYLEAGIDYQQFDLVSQIGRVPAASLQWSAEVERRVRDLVGRAPMVSLHDHLSVRPADPRQYRAYRRQGREVMPYLGMAASELNLVFDGGPASTGMIRSHTAWDWDDTISDLGMRLSDIAHQSDLAVVTNLHAWERVRHEGRTGVVLTIESASPIGNDVDRIDVLFGFGVRLMGLTYSESNLVGGGLADVDGGLTRFGRQVVQRMNQLGMVVDVAHCGDRTSLDAMEISEQPVLISHAGARALWPTARMKPDDAIRACAQTGGVIGIEAAPYSTLTRTQPKHTIDSVMEHVEYCLELVGPDYVAFGPDTHFGDHVAWLSAYSSHIGPAVTASLDTPVKYVIGCENPMESVSNMVRWLVNHGYSDEVIEKLMGGNVVRVMRQVWAHLGGS